MVVLKGQPTGCFALLHKDSLVLVATVAQSFQGSSKTAQGQKSSKCLYWQYGNLLPQCVLLCGVWLCIDNMWGLWKVYVIPFNHIFSFLLFSSENASKKELWRENEDYQDSGECVKIKKKNFFFSFFFHTVAPKKYLDTRPYLKINECHSIT